MGCQQCLPLSVVQLKLKVKHCRKPHCPNGVVDTFGLFIFLAKNQSHMQDVYSCINLNIKEGNITLKSLCVCLKKCNSWVEQFALILKEVLSSTKKIHLKHVIRKKSVSCHINEFHVQFLLYFQIQLCTMLYGYSPITVENWVTKYIYSIWPLQ